MKEATADKEARALLWGFLGQQWPLLLIGFPFMFAGSLIEFLVPSYIGQIINKFKEGNFEEEGGVYDLLWEWIIVLIITVVCSFFRELIFGVTSWRLGRSIRQRLFESIISKDVNFFDNIRTGDMLSRLGSDTQVVQNGLTTSVSMLVKSAVTALGSLVIMFTYDWRLALIIIVAILP